MLHSFQPDADPRRWSPTSWEARLLAGTLRSVPVTLLHGSDAANRDELLRHGVLPLLGRRAEDQVAPAAQTAQVLNFPDRRGSGPRRSDAPAELVLLVDDWPPSPLPSLAERIKAAQDAAPGDEGSEPGRRVLLVLQGFEPSLAAAAVSLFPDPFWRELGMAVSAPAAKLHLLIVTGDPTTPGLRWLSRDIGGLGQHALQLGESPSIAAPLTRVPGLPARPPVADDADWLKGVNDALRRVSSSVTQAEAPPDAAAAVETAPEIEIEIEIENEGEGEAPPPVAALLASPPLPPKAPKTTASRSRRWTAPALGLAACIGIVWAWSILRTGDDRPVAAVQPQAPVQPAPQPPAAVAAQPTPPPQPQPRPQPPAPPAEQGRAVLQALAPLPALDLRSSRAEVAAQLTAKGPPLLALVRYDALQGLPRTKAFDGLRVVAPLFIEPLQVWVPADSQRRGLQDLKGAVLDTGGNGGDALSAAGLRKALFGERAAAAARQTQLGDEAVLPAMLLGDVDAVLRTGTSPLAGMASLRLLSFDPADATSARALHDYLAVSTAAGQPVLGVMNFLVVRGGDSAAGNQLAGQAMRALCAAALPGLRPDLALPAGRLYAPAAAEAAAACSPRPSPVQTQGDPR